MSLQPHQQRVVDEQAELVERLARLRAFFQTPVCLALPFAERSRLSRQAALMGELSDVLAERIAAFE